MLLLLQPLSSLFLFILGAHSINLYISVMLTLQGHTQQEVSLISSMGFLGLALAGFRTDELIHRWGLRGSFAFCILLTALLGIFFFYTANSYVGIAIVRLLLGVVVGFMYVVTESWVLLTPPVSARGQHLAYYMLVLYVGQMLSPFLLEVTFSVDYALFLLSGLITLTSLFPLLMIQTHPIQHTPKEDLALLSMRYVYNRSPIGFLGAALSGLSIGSFTSLLPYYAVKTTLPVSLMMFAYICGGAVFQWPIGSAADFWGRKKIMALLCIGTLVPTFFLMSAYSLIVVLFNLFVLGALVFAIYPVAIAITCDRVQSGEVISATKIVLLAWSLGAVVGAPLIATSMEYLSSNKLLFLLNSLIAAMLGVLIHKKVLKN